jgi:hypothetical protein
VRATCSHHRLRVQIMELLIMYFPFWMGDVSCLLDLNTSLSTLFSNTFNNISSFMVTDSVSHPQNPKQRVNL